jgi:hypothetical protein
MMISLQAAILRLEWNQRLHIIGHSLPPGVALSRGLQSGRARQRLRTLMALAFLSPVFCNLLRGLVQPVMVSRETNHFDGGKPFRRIGSRLTERCQLAHGHQNLNVTLRETKQFRRRHNIKAGRQIFDHLSGHRRLLQVVRHNPSHTRCVHGY